MDYSRKDFTGRTLIEATDLNDQTITGSCFSQETPDSEIFPVGMTGVTFINCNLDNVVIPDGNTLIDCSNRRFQVQNDLNDWEIDHNDEPVKLVNSLVLDKMGIDQPDPASLPDDPVETPIDYTDLNRDVGSD